MLQSITPYRSFSCGPDDSPTDHAIRIWQDHIGLGGEDVFLVLQTVDDEHYESCVVRGKNTLLDPPSGDPAYLATLEAVIENRDRSLKHLAGKSGWLTVLVMRPWMVTAELRIRCEGGGS
ncbi:MAG: hypothetical protein KC619_35400 [Myxococcales bacterium]|nr:hypothetical protein [Myxococcales bacterium]